MTQTRKGIDRIKVASLRSRVRLAEENLRTHKTVCAQCSLYENKARHSCDDGWKMLKEVSRAANFLATYLGTAADKSDESQGVLF